MPAGATATAANANANASATGEGSETPEKWGLKRMQTFAFSELERADLVVDAVYQGGRIGNAGDDPFPRLLRLSNMGGFRYRGSLATLEMVVLTTSMSDPDWPDALDPETGVFTYYGDNKRPGRALHDTPRNGNQLLSLVFQIGHEGVEGRRKVPPILLFANTGDWRDVIFLGLAVPGTADLRASEDLVAIWRTSLGRRFQNYRARLTVLDVPVVSRAWMADILEARPHTANAPGAWLAWVETGHPRPLVANRTVEYRSRSEQLPQDAEGMAIVRAIHEFFADRPHGFEACAAAIARLMLPEIAALDLTRPSRDGGRDAIGQLRIGRGSTSILVDFALEAKCYGASSSVGVRDMSRLISRLRHRQFGILVTTSHVDIQAYREIKEDRHPVVVISGGDIVDVLRFNGHSTVAAVTSWLRQEFAGSP
jgi:Restriction endonuclease AspBHI N-terminal/Restriction endonuclease